MEKANIKVAGKNDGRKSKAVFQIWRCNGARALRSELLADYRVILLVSCRILQIGCELCVILDLRVAKCGVVNLMRIGQAMCRIKAVLV
jgi:hypothetical protein